MQRVLRWGWLVCAAGVLAACAGSPGSRFGAGVEIKVLSNRADLVSGGDALVEVVLPTGAAVEGLRVDVDGRDVSSSFKQRADGRVVGLISGLKDGDNVVTARNGRAGARLTITNYPIGGPIFSGQQVQPWVCATPTAQPATDTSPATNASDLSTAAIDAQCNVASEDRLLYRTTEQCSQRSGGTPCFKPYDPNAATPADLAETTNDQGMKVNYIVHVERGVLNRAIYDMAVLFDPSSGAAEGGLAAWNRKLLWSFGGGSGTPYKQFAPNSTWQVDYALARGYLVAVSAHTDQQLNSNHVVAAETVMMGKEHIIERYGEIKYTIGTGCSGGSIMQLQLASLLSRPARRHPAFVHVSGFVFDRHGSRRLRDARQLLRIAGIRDADEGADAGAGRGEESGDRRAPGRKGVPRMGAVVRQLEQSRRVHASAHEQVDQQLSSARQPGLRRRRKIPTASAARLPSTRSQPGAPCPARASRAGRTTTSASSTG